MSLKSKRIMERKYIRTTVADKCCGDHAVLMSSPLITAAVDGSHTSLVTATVVWAVFCGLLQQPEQAEQYLALLCAVCLW